jgi:tRNA(Ile)-lysidine synthase
MSHTVPHDPIERALRASLRRGETVVAAVSGGADSMAMLHALCAIARERELTVIAAHFDHQLRPSSYLDADLVFRMAHRWGARIAPGRGDVLARRMQMRTSVEAAGRELRYAFLERVADETRADTILTAHTRDDQVETVLMRILRGAGARGCRGILARRGRIARPLLSVARADTHEYCGANGVPVVEDPSNLERIYTRNRLRHDVLPELRAIYPGIDNALLRIAENADAEFQRAEAATARRLQVYLRPEMKQTWVLGLDAFTGLDDPDDRLHLINAAFDAINALNDVTEEHHRQVVSLLSADVGSMTSLPDVHVRREHDGLVFARNGHGVESEVPIYMLTAPGVLNFGGWHMEACRVDAPAPGEFSNNGNGVAYLACDDMIVVRYPREGDRIQPFGMEGHKKLSDVFIDRKIPKRRRASTPVIEVDGEIVWVVGVATSEKCRITGDARSVVKVTATRSPS